jgi:3-phytase
MNNVDLRDDVQFKESSTVVVAASSRADKNHARLELFKLDTKRAQLVELASLAAGKGEGYGLCLYQHGQDLHAFMIMREGILRQFRLDFSGAEIKSHLIRSIDLGSRAEGRMADDRRGLVYISQERVGFWRLDANGAADPTLIARTDKDGLVK